jgi:small-conductance mechanosensitive channel
MNSKKSDLNFAIEIPFPQRDVHVRDWAGTSKSEAPPKQEEL